MATWGNETESFPATEAMRKVFARLSHNAGMGKAHSVSHMKESSLSHDIVAPELNSLKLRLEDLERGLTAVQLGFMDDWLTWEDIVPLEDELSQISSMQHDGAFKVDGKIPAGQACLSNLLNRCYMLANLIKARVEREEHAAEKQRHAMHTRLQQIMMRGAHNASGAFAGPVDESLSEIEGQLKLIEKRLLHHLANSASCKLEDLRPLQAELGSIDSKREDGCFKVKGAIPAGQARLSNLLNHCYVVLELLKDRVLAHDSSAL